ncbi:hypothetical protein HanRHA438_Chr07g0294271 [Helianthus annuus]|nr:hypothetical protein HanRHA438_Chr07g0294271 [Helianthus annuus]
MMMTVGVCAGGDVGDGVGLWRRRRRRFVAEDWRSVSNPWLRIVNPKEPFLENVQTILTRSYLVFLINPFQPLTFT